MKPNLYSYTYIIGEFNYNAAPLAPPGTKVVTHDNIDFNISQILNIQLHSRESCECNCTFF